MRNVKRKEKNIDSLAALKKHRFSLTDKKITGWVFLLPMTLVLYLFIWRPTVFGFFYSLFDMRGFSLVEFSGFDNYRKVIMHTQFLPILWNTVQYVLWSFVIGFLPPLIIAIMLNEVIHFRNILRLIIYIPVTIPGVAAMLIWYFVYYPDGTGLLNMLLNKMGMESFGWLNNEAFAIPGIVIYMTWKSFGSSMLLYYAALQGTSVELYEAAILDGAGVFRRFWTVTRPSIEGILLLNAVRQIISVFQIMNEPLAMTGGGPNGATNSMAYQLFEYGFNSGGKATGQAMALGVIIFCILIIATLFYFKLDKKIQNRYY